MISIDFILDSTVRVSDVDHYDASDNFYPGDLVNAPDISVQMASEDYGIISSSPVITQISDRDGSWLAIVGAQEIRGKQARIYRVDDDGSTFVCGGRITGYEISDTVNISIALFDDQVMQTTLPLHTTTADRFCDKIVDTGKPVNICFGHCINVPLHLINNDTSNNHYDYLIGYGPIEGIWEDADNGRGVRRGDRLVDMSEYLLYDGSQTAPYPGFAFIRFTVEQKDFGGNFYTLTGDIKGLKCGGSTASRSFPTVISWLLTSSDWGLGGTIDSTSFTAAQAYLSTNYLCDGAITSDRQAGDIINDLLYCIRADIQQNETGTWEISVEQAAVSSGNFGANDGYYNNAETVRMYNTPADQAWKNVTLRYGSNRNEDGGYNPYEMALSGFETFGVEKTVDLSFVEDADTAKRILSFIQRKNFYGDLFLEAKLSLEGKNLAKGDIITYTDSRLGISAQDFLVESVSKNNREKYSVTLRKYNPAFYDMATIISPATQIEGDTTVSKPAAIVDDATLGDGAARGGRITLLRAEGYGDTYIAAGKTDFVTTTDGFIIGIDDSDGLAKLYLGNANKYIVFDGVKPMIKAEGFTLAADGSVAIADGSIVMGDPTGDRVVLDSDGLRGYSDALGQTFDIPSDGSAPTFSSGTIKETEIQLFTSGVIKTSDNPATTGGYILNNNDLIAYKTDGSKMFEIDIAAGTCNLSGTMNITGGSGIGNLSDAGDLATKSRSDLNYTDGADVTANNVAADVANGANNGFEMGYEGLIAIPQQWTFRTNAAGVYLEHYLDTPVGSTGTISFGADSYSQNGGVVGWWAIGKRYIISTTGSILTITVQIKPDSCATTDYDGSADANQTFIGEDDAFIQVRCYKQNGDEIALALTDEYSTTAAHQDYAVNGSRVLNGSWLSLSHSLIIPVDTYRIFVEIVMVDGNNSVQNLGFLSGNAAVKIDDFEIHYPSGLIECGDETWAAVAGADVTADQQGELQLSPSDNMIPNPDFELGYQGWVRHDNHNQSLEDSSYITEIVVSSTAIYGGKALRCTNDARFETRKYIPIDTSRSYYGEAIVQAQSIDSEKGYNKFYFGVRCYDENKTALGNRYFIAYGPKIYSAQQTATYSNKITGEGTTNTTFYSGTKYVCPLGLINYQATADNSAVSDVLYMRFSEIQSGADNTATTIDGGITTTGTLQLKDGAGAIKTGMTAAGTGDTNVRIWAGDTYANRATAPFRVTQDGKIAATDINPSGDLATFHGMANINQGGCNVVKTTNQSMANNTTTIIDWDSEEWDTHNEFNLSTHRYTLSQGGKIFISAYVVSDYHSWGTGDEWDVTIFVNGSQKKLGANMCQESNSNQVLVASISAALDLDAGDYIDIRIFQTRGYATTLLGQERMCFACFQKIA